LSSYRIEAITDYEELLRLKPEWDRLMAEAPVHHPFLSHEWMCTWWKHLGTGRQLHVLLAKERDALRGIAPLQWTRKWMYGMRVRTLGFLYNPHTPRCDFIVARSAEEAYPALWEHMRNGGPRWDALELPQLPAGSRTLRIIQKLADSDGLLTGIWQGELSPYVPGQTWETYRDSLERGHRKNLSRRLKNLSKIGDVALEVVTSSEGLERALEDVYRIEAAAWKGKAGTAIGDDPGIRRFYTSLAERTAKRGWLHLSFLTLNRRRISARYGLCHENRLYLLKSGYDPEFAKSSPASLHLSLLLQEAFSRGIAECDFLGGIDEWKFKWTQALRSHQWLYVFPRSSQGRFLHAVKFRIGPKMKRLHQRLNSHTTHERA